MARLKTNKLKIDDRVHKIHEQQAFITVKDHKDNFPNNPQFWFLNPSKNNIGKISKGYTWTSLQLHHKILNATGVNQ